MEATPARSEKQNATFFRQSGWLMFATIVAGGLAFCVHPLSKKVPDGQYASFGAVLNLVSCLPTIAIQMVFAHQVAEALVKDRRRQVASMIRQTCFWSFVLWAVAAVLVFVFRERIVARWQLPDATILWITLGAIFVSIWTPIFGGVLQGRQDFLWLGWATLSPGILRLGVAAVLVLVFHGGAASMMAGALAGVGFGMLIAMWRTRDWWLGPGEKFNYGSMLGRTIPLLLGFWSCQFLFTSDVMFAKAFFPGKEVDPYVIAGTLGRGVQWLVLPMAAVMFPKLVQSAAKSEKNNLLKLVLGGTAALSICGGIGLWLVGPHMIKIVGKPEWVEPARALLPWYAAAIVFLALANVLANDLLARGRFKVVPFMVAIAITYGFALPYVLKNVSLKLETILQTLTFFNFLLLVVCAWAAFGKKSSQLPTEAAPLQV